MGDKRLKISDIAKATGYSNTTVSRALSGNGRVPEKTAKIIREYAEKVHYSPNINAVSLSVSKTYNIGILMPNTDDIFKMEFFNRCLFGMTKEFQGTYYDPLLFLDDDNGKVNRTIKRIATNRKVDAVVIMRAYDVDERIGFLKEHGIPCVLIGSSNENVYQVDYEHVENSRKGIVNIFTKINPKSVIYLSGSMRYTVNKNRYEGFKKACMEIRKLGYSVVIDELLNISGREVYEVRKRVNEYDLIICADEEVFSIASIGNSICCKYFVLECSDRTILENNVCGGIVCDPFELGSIIGKKIKHNSHFDENARISIDGAIRIGGDINGLQV